MTDTAAETKTRKPRRQSNYLVLGTPSKDLQEAVHEALGAPATQPPLFVVLATATTPRKAWAEVEKQQVAGEMMVVCVRGRRTGAQKYMLL